MVVDEEMKEVHIFIQSNGSDRRLYYTYGVQPRTYMNGITIGDQTFYLAYYTDYGAEYVPFIFMLYRCKSNNTSCHRLPFQYEENWLPYGYIEVDNSTGEMNLNIIIDNQLIFSYGANPRCYVEGCSLKDR